jgi:hypothetical protein
MENKPSDAPRVPVSRDVVSVLRRAAAPTIITDMMSLYADLAEKMRKQELTYLDLPPVLAPLALAPWYQEALCWGRGLYYDGLHGYDEKAKSLVRVPDPYTRQEIREYTLAFLSLDDPRITVAIPLSWRVGVAVGWLSGLAVSQREDVQAALVLLSALAAPFLVPQPASSGAPSNRSRKLARPVQSKQLKRNSVKRK